MTNPALSYLEKHLADNPFNSLTDPLMLSYVLCKPLMLFAFPIGLIFWKHLATWQKLSIAAIVSVDILSYIAIGTNKGIFDYVLVLPFLIFLKAYRTKRSIRKKLPSAPGVMPKGNYILALVALIFIVLSFSYFTSGNMDRKKHYLLYEPSTGVFIDPNSGVMEYIPSFLKFSYLSLDNYVTQGYYALELSLEMEFIWTYGLGHSFFTTTVGEKVLGDSSISYRTYQHRLEQEFGYSHYGKWHTFFVWFANDLSFPGVVLLVFFLSRMLGSVWHKSIHNFDILSVTLLMQLIIMFFYLPANNQVLGFMGSQVSFILLLSLWMLNGRVKF
ncbi:hypothetical protein ACQ661_05290 [Pseudidiomarina sp. WS423]|uniref:hypothetical protein n=1 Tax=Pseudidiomarina sp. WS423 TaxID=3425124 RepID=UPI003D6F4192